MLDEEQLNYVNSLKKTHPNVDKETLREALLGSEWTEIEIMEAITLYNNSNTNSASEKKLEENTEEKTKLVPKPKTDEDEPVVTVKKKAPGKLVSIITALLIILLFIVLVIIGSMVFFQMSLSEIITFLTVDLIDNISAKF